MKTKSILAALLLMLAGMQSASAQNAMQVWRNGKFEMYEVEEVDSVRFITLANEVTLSQDAVDILEDESIRLSASVSPKEAEEVPLVWLSDDPYIATVDENGLVTGCNIGICHITCLANDGSGVFGKCKVTVTSKYEYVDLWLPSGTLWAKTNIGANAPEEYGGYFAWGETQPKEDFSWETYAFFGNHVYEDLDEFGPQYMYSTVTKYCTDSKYGFEGFTDGLTELLPEDDAATANWGRNWRMPSQEQLKELVNNNYTTVEWTVLNGVAGTKITSNRNGQSIFLPAAGNRLGTNVFLTGRVGDIWSRNLEKSDPTWASCLSISEDKPLTTMHERIRGTSVRPVRFIRVQEIKLNKTEVELWTDLPETKSIQLHASIFPANASNKNVIWESSDERVATVDSNGLVTAVLSNHDTCTITCRATDGSGAYAECKVKVGSMAL